MIGSVLVWGCVFALVGIATGVGISIVHRICTGMGYSTGVGGIELVLELGVYRK